MVVFITSIRHPANSNSYERVLTLADRALRSVCNQTSDAFRVFVVCNQVPALAFSHPNIQFLQVNFPSPSCLSCSHIAVEGVRLDKGSKYLVGLVHAKRLNPSHVMFFDADDFISNRIAAFVRQDASHNGWFVKAGYIYSARRNAFMSMDGEFQTRCGTCYIVNASLFAVPQEFPADASQECILSHFGKPFILELLGSHRYLQDFLSKNGTPLEPLPFRGVVYHGDHGENWTRSFRFTRRLPKVILTEELRREFNLWPCENHMTQAVPVPANERACSETTNSKPLQKRYTTD